MTDDACDANTKGQDTSVQETIEAKRLTWDGPDTHVQLATGAYKVWSQAWKTDVPGLVVVHDSAHDLWTITHVPSGKAVARVQVPMVQRMKEAARELQAFDWTLAEEELTGPQRELAEKVGKMLSNVAIVTSAGAVSM